MNIFSSARTQKRLLLTNASGILATTASIMQTALESWDFDLVTSKSIELLPNPGYREPVLTQLSKTSFLNAVGLRNPGIEEFLESMQALIASGLSSRVIVSLSARSCEDLRQMLETLSPFFSLFELNLSCPHAKEGYGAHIGSRPELTASFLLPLRSLLRELCVLVKLSPLAEPLLDVAAEALRAGASGFSLFNTAGPYPSFHPASAQPILSNGVGGLSGSPLFPMTREALRSLREYFGPQPWIVAMGGVRTAQQIAELQKLGADAVALGSVFADLQPQDYESFIPRLRTELHDPSRQKKSLPSARLQMDFVPWHVASVEKLEDSLYHLIFEEARPDFLPGQLFFFWLPGLAEKPYSLAMLEPASLLIRVRGPFSRALSELKKGQILWSRGPYGQAAPLPSQCRSALILCGGSGLALSWSLSQYLLREGLRTRLLFASSGTNRELFAESFPSEITYRVICDEGREGRCLDVLAAEDAADRAKEALYVIGPKPFMERAAALWKDSGSPDIFLSLEETMLCGIGLCGLCSHKNTLTCKSGSFVRWD